MLVSGLDRLTLVEKGDRQQLQLPKLIDEARLRKDLTFNAQTIFSSTPPTLQALAALMSMQFEDLMVRIDVQNPPIEPTVDAVLHWASERHFPTIASEMVLSFPPAMVLTGFGVFAIVVSTP